jgi:glycine cleavage system transcriptional repressor
MAVDLVINVMSRDRVGIVSAVTRTISDLNGNIDAISQTVMRGYFTLILTVRFPDTLSADAVRQAVSKAGAPGELAVSVVPREPERRVLSGTDTDQFVLTILGKDRPGVISRISGYLASRNINIVDLYAYTEGEDFIMISQVMIPQQLDVRQIQIDLESLPIGAGLEIRLQHEDIFVATNEIEFRHNALRPKE